MKNWDTLEADVTKIMNVHFSNGREGNKINKIVIHHNAANLSVDQCYAVWQTREASAHYQVQADGTIGQLVWDTNTAWHAGDWNTNLTSIGVEHADITTNPWAVSEATLDNGAHLVAALCKYYGLGAPQWGVNVFPHATFNQTACPASLYGTQRDAYMQRAQYWYAQMTGTTAPVAPASVPAQNASGSIDVLAQRVLKGEFGTGAERQRRLGANYQAVQNRVNELLGATPTQTASVDIDDLVRRTMAGEFGNGDARRNALGANYEAVQARINQQYGIGAPSVDLNALADAVIRGEYGNGDTRRQNLGGNYAAVMAIVNKRLIG